MVIPTKLLRKMKANEKIKNGSEIEEQEEYERGGEGGGT